MRRPRHLLRQGESDPGKRERQCKHGGHREYDFRASSSEHQFLENLCDRPDPVGVLNVPIRLHLAHDVGVPSRLLHDEQSVARILDHPVEDAHRSLVHRAVGNILDDAHHRRHLGSARPAERSVRDIGKRHPEGVLDAFRQGLRRCARQHDLGPCHTVEHPSGEQLDAEHVEIRRRDAVAIEHRARQLPATGNHGPVGGPDGLLQQRQHLGLREGGHVGVRCHETDGGRQVAVVDHAQHQRIAVGNSCRGAGTLGVADRQRSHDQQARCGHEQQRRPRQPHRAPGLEGDLADSTPGARRQTAHVGAGQQKGKQKQQTAGPEAPGEGCTRELADVERERLHRHQHIGDVAAGQRGRQSHDEQPAAVCCDHFREHVRRRGPDGKPDRLLATPGVMHRQQPIHQRQEDLQQQQRHDQPEPCQPLPHVAPRVRHHLQAVHKLQAVVLPVRIGELIGVQQGAQYGRRRPTVGDANENHRDCKGGHGARLRAGRVRAGVARGEGRATKDPNIRLLEEHPGETMCGHADDRQGSPNVRSKKPTDHVDVGPVEPLPQRIADNGRHGAVGRGPHAPDSRSHPQEFQVVPRHVPGRDDLRRPVAAAVRHADRRDSRIGPCHFGHQAGDARDVARPNRTSPARVGLSAQQRHILLILHAGRQPEVAFVADREHHPDESERDAEEGKEGNQLGPGSKCDPESCPT